MITGHAAHSTAGSIVGGGRFVGGRGCAAGSGIARWSRTRAHRLPRRGSRRSARPAETRRQQCGVGVGGRRDAGQRRQHGHRQQPGDPGDVVVDRRGDARLMVRRGRQHRRGQRRDGEGQPEPEQQHRRDHVAQVGRPGPDPGQPDHRQPGDDRPDRHRDARPDPGRQPAHPGRQQQHHHGDRQGGGAGLHRAEPGHQLQLHGQQEQRAGQRRVDIKNGCILKNS